MKKLKIGVSACLIGLKFRYNGESKFNPEIIRRLDKKIDWIPVCPEVEAGLGVPRPEMRLEVSPRGTRLKVKDSGADETERLTRWAELKLEQLEKRGISGFLFRKKSPSCGLASTEVYSPAGRLISEAGSGIFATMLRHRFPKMVIGEEKDIEEFIRSLGLDKD